MKTNTIDCYAQLTNPPPMRGEVMRHNRKVSMAGYLPPEERIKSMVMAGQRLYDARKAFYDDMEGKKEPDIDPTRAKDFDFAEADKRLNEIKEKIEKTKKERQAILEKAKMEMEKRKNAQKPEEKAPVEGAK